MEETLRKKNNKEEGEEQEKKGGKGNDKDTGRSQKHTAEKEESYEKIIFFLFFICFFFIYQPFYPAQATLYCYKRISKRQKQNLQRRRQQTSGTISSARFCFHCPKNTHFSFLSILFRFFFRGGGIFLKAKSLSLLSAFFFHIYTQGKKSHGAVSARDVCV